MGGTAGFGCGGRPQHGSGHEVFHSRRLLLAINCHVAARRAWLGFLAAVGVLGARGQQQLAVLAFVKLARRGDT